LHEGRRARGGGGDVEGGAGAGKRGVGTNVGTAGVAVSLS
jgi:hypothetical protein